MTRPRVDHEMKEKARGLRKRLTKGEVLLWLELRALRSAGLHFRKQVPIGPYIADFACLAARLVIEVDGDRHETEAGKQHDANRDAYLKSLGYVVLRFDEPDVRTNAWQVAQEVKSVIERVMNDPTRPLRGHPPRDGEGPGISATPTPSQGGTHP